MDPPCYRYPDPELLNDLSHLLRDGQAQIRRGPALSCLGQSMSALTAGR